MHFKSKGITVRYLVIIATLVLFSASASFGMTETSFEEFLESREVVATFYFEKNSETLTPDELKRVSAALSELRGLQKSGRMLRVEGFSSPEGDREKNFELSFYRAKSVADVLDAGGLPSEVALTGYGDLKASLDDSNKERRVEIASYITPVGLKRVKIAKNKAPKIATVPEMRYDLLEYQEIDSYKVDQAIRRKVDDKARSIAEQIRKLEEELTPGISKNKHFNTQEEIENGYTQWRRSVDPEYSPKVTQVIRRADTPRYSFSQLKDRLDKEAPKLGQAKDIEKDLQRGYSQLDEEKAKDSPKLGQARDAEENIQRGYSRTGDKATEDSLRLGQAKDIEKGLQRGYSQLDEEKTKDTPKLGQARDADNNIQRGYSHTEDRATEEAPKLGQTKDIEPGYSQLDEKPTDDTPKLGRVKNVEDGDLRRGYSQLGEDDTKDAPKLGRVKDADSDIKRGYSQVDEKPEKSAPKLRQAKVQDSELQRSLTEWVESIEASRAQSTLLWPADTPLGVDDEAIDVTMILSDEYAPNIDALMIEQAIMDKLGVAPTASSGPVTRVELNKEELAVQ